MYYWRSLVILGISAGIVAGCKTNPSGSTLRDADVPGASGSAGFQPDFCVSPDATRASIEHLSANQWGQIFSQGLASASLIPSADNPNVMTPGLGFPRIFSSFLLNATANHIWDGKTMITDDEGNTRLYNRFVGTNETPSLDLFTARVVIDQSKWLHNDGKPVILLDYRQSKLTDPTQSLGAIDSVVVPVISAIRDEIRLVCQNTQADGRHRLYLGPTFLLPDMMPTAAGRFIAQKFANVPFLWFALEFVDTPAVSSATGVVSAAPSSAPSGN